MSTSKRPPLLLSPGAASEPAPARPPEVDEPPTPEPADGAARDAASPDPSPVPGDERGARPAAVVFGVALVAAFFLLLHHASQYWFYGDDWGMLVGRSLFDPGDLLRPQNTHWSTLPMVVYQVLYRVVGLEPYVAYQLPTILLHLGLATLMRVVMRRAGVGPWLATAAAVAFLFFGPAYENMLLAIQMSMVGSVVLGYAMLLLTDHDGGFQRRDAWGILAGLGAVMASGMGPPLIFVVGLAVLIRRGVRMAAACTAPIAAAYVLWYLVERDVMSDQRRIGQPTVGALYRWVATGETGGFVLLGHWRPVGVVLAGVLVVGLVLAIRQERFADLRRRIAVPLALFLAGPIVLAASGWQRWVFGEGLARSSRYMGVVVACSLPLLAVAADAIVRRYRWSLVPVAALFLVGVPSNVDALEGGIFVARYERQHDLLLAVAASPLLDDAPADHRPDPHPLGFGPLTVDFLRETRDAGRISVPDEVDPALADEARVRLTVGQSRDPAQAPLPDDCAILDAPLELDLEQGDQWSARANILVRADGPAGWSSPAVYDVAWGGGTFTLIGPDQTLLVEPLPGAGADLLCH
jgi:hypothetical protein